MRDIKLLYLADFRPLTQYQKSHIEKYVSPQRLKRASLFSDEEKLNRFLYAEILTAELISENFSVYYPFFSGHAGEKPKVINNPEISFSRSYSDNKLVIYLEDSDKSGVDCENTDDFDKNVLKYFYTDNEQKYINSSPSPTIASNLLWTRKESLIKYYEKGLEYPLLYIDLTPDEIYHMGGKNLTVYKNNFKINNCFINSYLYDNIAISVCSSTNECFPQISEIK